MQLNVKCCSPYVGMKTVLNIPDRGSKAKFYMSYSSYLFRAYVCYKKLVDFHQQNGYGFGLFDTLTYRQSELPMFQGLPCFSPKDITLFMKRLRTNLERKIGHRPVIDFILVCEYGDIKQRPHYHPVFFVYERMSPNEFALAVWQAWRHGKTDSVDVYGRLQYDVVSRHVLFSFAAVRYILKYILKYIECDEKFSEVLDKLKQRYDVEEFEAVRREYLIEHRPFIRTSVGFGYTTQFDNNDELTISVPIDATGKFEVLRCPSYIFRKLFYDKQVDYYDGDKVVYKRTEKGSYLYTLNDLGREYKAKNLQRSIAAAVDLYSNLLSGLNEYEKKIFDYYLGGRSLTDLAIYQLVYQHRILDIELGKFLENHSPFDIIDYQAVYLKMLDCVPLDPFKLNVIVDENSTQYFWYFDTLLNFLDQLQRYSHVKLSELPCSQEQQLTIYNHLNSVKAYANDSCFSGEAVC